MNNSFIYNNQCQPNYDRFPDADAHIAVCSIPPRKGHERNQKSANDATIGVNSYLQALSRRSNNVQ